MKPDSEQLFTDSPRVSIPTFLIGSVQLVFWLFVHPSAWRPIWSDWMPIAPTFCLSDLTCATGSLAHLALFVYELPHLALLLGGGLAGLPGCCARPAETSLLPALF
jgi:hypothetical protein